ncbi:MAG: L,D-transpeptidase family protein [Verrucomicrobiota bacterium]
MSSRLRFLVFGWILIGAAALMKEEGGFLWRPVLAQIAGERTVRSVVADAIARGKGLTEAEQEEAFRVVLIGLKEEERLEAWLVDKEETSRQIRSYPFTANSGVLGPKLKEGDLQIPEGIYKVEYLNPQSSYHLSIKLDYPNAFDRARAEEEGRTQLGGDIFIHGRAVTIGCIPIGDEAIEDLFAIVDQIGTSKVRVIIAPRDFRKGLEEPEIERVEWEASLYQKIREALQPFGPGDREEE